MMVQIDENILNLLISKAIPPNNEQYTNRFEETLKKNLQSQVEACIQVLTTEEYRNARFKTQKQKQEFLDTLHDKSKELLNQGYTDIDEIINTLYSQGRKEGLKDLTLHDTVIWGNGDRYALQHLIDYDMGLIKNVTDDLRRQVSDNIFDGVLTGESIPEISRNIRRIPEFEPLPDSNLTANQRATLIARTETMRASNVGTLNTYKEYGLDKVDIMPAVDACDECIDFAETYNPLTLEEAEGVLPLHPNCRCVYGPAEDFNLSEPDINFDSVEPVPEELLEEL